ncbi:hypothetical protein ACFLQT_00090 [Bacteroidota bacterium]
MYEFFVKILGGGISAVIFFLPLQVEYDNQTLTVKADLQNPVTEEVAELVQNGYVFSLDFYCSTIINNNKVFRQTTTKVLTYKNDWFIDSTKVKIDDILTELGELVITFNNIYLHDNDEIVIFIKTTISPDSEFKKSTGLSTRILWNYYVPRVLETYKYFNNRLILQ